MKQLVVLYSIILMLTGCARMYNYDKPNTTDLQFAEDKSYCKIRSITVNNYTVYNVHNSSNILEGKQKQLDDIAQCMSKKGYSVEVIHSFLFNIR